MKPGYEILNQILDFPNNYSLEFCSDMNVIQNPETNKILRGNKFSLSSDNNTKILSGRIKNKCSEFIATNSEIHVKILKHLKSAVQIMEEEKNIKPNFNFSCQSILDKLKPIISKNDEILENTIEAEIKPSKRK